MIDFNSPVISLLGMDKGESTPEDIEKLKKMVPKSYQKYIESELHFVNLSYFSD